MCVYMHDNYIMYVCICLCIYLCVYISVHVCVCAHMHLCMYSMCVEVRGQLCDVSLFSTFVWVPGVKLQLSDLSGSTFSH